MHYLLLAIGIIIGLYALYRFFMKANIQQIKSLFLTAGFLAFCAALFYLAVSGRLPAALGLVVATIPFIFGYLRERQKIKSGTSKPDQSPEINTEAEALEILGLKPGATEEDIQKAYKKLMQKVHPDNEGSDWMAAKLNAARDILLERNSSS